MNFSAGRKRKKRLLFVSAIILGFLSIIVLLLVGFWMLSHAPQTVYCPTIETVLPKPGCVPPHHVVLGS